MPYKKKLVRANYMRDYRRKKTREKILAEQAAASARRQVPMDESDSDSDSDSDMKDEVSTSSSDGQDPCSNQPEMSIPAPKLTDQTDDTAQESEGGGETVNVYEYFGSARIGK